MDASSTLDINIDGLDMFYPTAKDGTAATPTIEDMSEVPSHGITVNKPIEKGGTAAKPATEAC